MYSITARFNQIVFFTSWTLVILSILNQGTAYYFKTGKASVDMSILSADKFHHYKATYYNGGKTDWDQATFKFNLNADFEPVFNWNLKQLFLYVNVHSNTNTNLQSDCVIYDRIIQRPDSPSEWNAASKLSLKNQRVEYPLRDSHKQLRNATLLFEVWIEIMPYVGYIRREKIGEFPYNMPTEILVTEKGIEWQRELSQEQYLIRPKYLQIRQTVEMPNITQRTQLSSKRRKPVNSVLEYLPKYCEMQGFVESVNELNRSCDLKGINETLKLRKERLKLVIII